MNVDVRKAINDLDEATGKAIMFMGLRIDLSYGLIQQHLEIDHGFTKSEVESWLDKATSQLSVRKGQDKGLRPVQQDPDK